MPASVRSWCPSTQVLLCWWCTGTARSCLDREESDWVPLAPEQLPKQQTCSLTFHLSVLASLYATYCILSVHTCATGEDETAAAPQAQEDSTLPEEAIHHHETAPP